MGAARVELVKWHNIVHKGFSQVLVIVNESVRQFRSPQGRDPVDMRFRLDFTLADVCHMFHKPSFASFGPVNRPESAASSIPRGRKRKPGFNGFLKPIACKQMSGGEHCILKKKLTRI